MRAVHETGVALLGVLLAVGGLEASAQTAMERIPGSTPAIRTQVPTPAPPEIAVEATQSDREMRWAVGHIAVRVGQDYILRDGESVREIVVVNGSATIEGYVRDNVTVAFGTLRLASTAVIEGSLVVVGGNATVEPGAVLRENLLVIGGRVEGPPNFTPGRDHFVIGATPLLERARAFAPWLSEGLLMGRPIVPRLGWVWTIVAITFFVSLVLTLIFLDAVRLCAEALAARPLSTFLVGLLVLLLTGPLAVILAASVIGIAVVPFLLCAVAIAWLLGKVGVAVWIGGSAIGMRVPSTRPQAVLAYVLGFAVICIAYMVPILGFVVYGLVGVVGLGAASLAFITAYRRENPAPPKAARTPPPVTAPPAAPLQADAMPMGETPVDPPVSQAAPDSLVFFPRASFLDRLCAFALDCALVLIANEMLDLTRSDGGPILLLLAYHIVFWTWKGTTIGGIICQLRLVRMNGEPLRFVDALVRGLSSLFSIAVLGLGCFWILRDPERQAWHDKIAGTYVVKVPRSWPVP